MITHLKTKQFKGLNLDEELAQKTIYTGQNTAGKSARAAAIVFALLGFIPFAAKTNKKAADLLDDFGNGDSMLAEVTCGGHLFERKLWRKKSGSVTTNLRVDQKGCSKSEFAVALDRAGGPKIIDLNEFVAFSDAKKIETLFRLYPPTGDLSNLDSDIEKSKKKISSLEESNRNATGAIKNLTKSKTDIELPAGSLAETKTKIQDIAKGIKESEQALVIAEQKNAKELKAQEVDTGKPDDFVTTQADVNKTMDQNSPPVLNPAPTEPQNVRTRLQNSDPYPNTYQTTAKDRDFPVIDAMANGNHPVDSIQAIIDVLKASGCSMCAGLMVAKKEQRKYKGGAK